MKRAHKQLLRDPLAYVESIGRHDRHHTIEALADEGKDTIMRLVIAPSGRVPMRTFGYIAAARHIQREYLPHAQLQIVVPRNTMNTVNSTKFEHIDEATAYINRELFFVPSPAYTESDSVLVADKPDPPFVHVNRLLYAMRGIKGEDKLKAQGARRNASYVSYLAGHVAIHDIVASVVPFGPSSDEKLSSAQRIVSIGAQTERPFYNARMAARQKNLQAWGTDLCEATGQIFTRHTLPPYLPRRQPKEGLPLFDPFGMDLDAFKDPVMEDQYARRYDPVARDIVHLYDYMRMAYSSYSEAVTAS